jgi:hypothetical protein
VVGVEVYFGSLLIYYSEGLCRFCAGISVFCTHAMNFLSLHIYEYIYVER